MGEVFLLRDGVIGRDVAMKSIRQELQGDGLTRARFLREARIQGQLEHPSIVPVYDLGIGPTGQPYFTMRRVRGRTLDELSRDGKLPLHAALTVMGRVCLAIDFAHTHGVLHRDIKPSNIMVGDWGEVYVLDWGVAKVAGGEDIQLDSRVALVGDATDATTAGALLGTPGYMSPEQAQGQTVDARGDIYSLGSTLFEMITSQALHTDVSIAAIIRSTIAGADARISKRLPDADIPLELETICIRATRTSPEDRFPSARAMHDAIERFLEGDRDLERRRKRSREHARAAEKLARAAHKRTNARSAAMREVGRALALDPGNRDAMRTMVALLTDPPKMLPRDVAREMNEEQARNILTARRYAGVGFVSPVIPAICAWMMGVREMGWFAITVGAGILGAIAAVIPSDTYAAQRRWAAIGLSLLGMIATYRILGAFMVIPVLSFGLAIGLIIFPRPFPLKLAIAVGWFPVVAPLVLARLGIIPTMYEFGPDRLCIRAQLLSFPELATIGYLLLMTLPPIAAVCVYVARLRERADAADRRLRLVAWQLRQIVPR
jgi:serine/threonine-protein kinase